MTEDRKLFGKINYLLGSASMIIFFILIIDVIYFYSQHRDYQFSYIFSVSEIFNFYVKRIGYNVTILTFIFSMINIYFHIHRAIKIKKNSFIRNASLFTIIYNPVTMFLLMHQHTNSFLRIITLIFSAFFTILWIKDFVIEEEYFLSLKEKNAPNN